MGYFQHLNSLSIPHLPSIDDEDMKLSSPSSPSMRSFKLLPTDDAMSVSPSSQGLPICSLPGVNTDDDLLSEELGPSTPTFAPNSALSLTRSLLLQAPFLRPISPWRTPRLIGGIFVLVAWEKKLALVLLVCLKTSYCCRLTYITLGDIYLRINIILRESCAKKFPSNLSPSKPNTLVYKTLASGVGVPFVRWFGPQRDYNAMIFCLFRPSLEDLSNFCN